MQDEDQSTKPVLHQSEVSIIKSPSGVLRANVNAVPIPEARQWRAELHAVECEAPWRRPAEVQVGHEEVTLAVLRRGADRAKVQELWRVRLETRRCTLLDARKKRFDRFTRLKSCALRENGFDACIEVFENIENRLLDLFSSERAVKMVLRFFKLVISQILQLEI